MLLAANARVILSKRVGKKTLWDGIIKDGFYGWFSSRYFSETIVFNNKEKNKIKLKTFIPGEIAPFLYHV